MAVESGATTRDSSTGAHDAKGGGMSGDVGSPVDDSGPADDGGLGDDSASADSSPLGEDSGQADDDSSAPKVEDSGSQPDSAKPDSSVTGAITFVQLGGALTANSASSLNFTFAAAQSAGDLIVLAVGSTDTTSSVTAVADTAGNTYVLAVGPTTYGQDLSQSIYYAAGIKAAASNKVTVTFGASTDGVDLRAAEYAGLDTATPLDVTATASGESTTASSGATTTTRPRELLFGAGMTTDIFTAGGSGFDLRSVTTNGDMIEDEIVSATGSYAATGTQSQSAEWVIQLATFHQ